MLSCFYPTNYWNERLALQEMMLIKIVMVILIQVGGSPFVQLCAGERHRGEREQMNQPQTYAESEI